ncbi:hypothetical protein C5167_044825 [Papaver somniferum]|nr:hypothetical protein C5167_044825 [Papaver somniferum]
MYAVKIVDVGGSKDPFLTQVPDFAVLFGTDGLEELVCRCVAVSLTEIARDLILLLRACDDCRLGLDSAIGSEACSHNVTHNRIPRVEMIFEAEKE